MVTTAELQQMDDKRQARKESRQILIVQPAPDGFTSIHADWFDPIVLADQEERQFAAITNCCKQTHGLVADIPVSMKADEAK
jgi:hypothetical protein